MKTYLTRIALIATVFISNLITTNVSAIGVETNCTDKIDNDGDGDIDMFDSDCSPFSLGFACSDKFYLTRQITSPSNATVLSTINFVSGDINVGDNKTYAGLLLNASFYYNGFLYAFGHTPSSNTLYQLKNNGTTSSMTITGLPSSSWNNAVCTPAGQLLLLENGTQKLWKVNLHTLAVTSVTLTGISDSPSISVWGDLVIDPTNFDIYCWYHPTSASSVRGLYKVDTVNNKFMFMGTNTSNTMGSLFFNSSGTLYGYGSATIGGVQDRFYTINKTTGVTTQFGTPDMQVTQTDACNCGSLYASTLPVELTSFTGKAQNNNTTLLTWATASEMNNDHFEIQRSIDVVKWDSIGTVKGSGNSKQLVTYVYTDQMPTAALEYYRLVQVDINGEINYSPIISVRFLSGDLQSAQDPQASAENITIFPNPTKSDICVKMNEVPDSSEAQIYNFRGDNIANVKLKDNVQYISLNEYPSGMYLIIIGTKLFKITKE